MGIPQPYRRCCCGISSVCCANSLPLTLTVQAIFPSGPCMGTVEFEINWSVANQQWETEEIICGDFGDTVQFFFYCEPISGDWYAASPAQPGSQPITGTLECDPFYVELDDGSGSFGFPGGTATKVVIFE